jgi:hypothetical protein
MPGRRAAWDARLSVTGSQVCSPDWLALREPADAAARASELVERLGRHAVIRDLGCGTGSMGRWLGPHLPSPQRWILHDRDPELLALAAVSTPAVADVLTEFGDVTALSAADLVGTSLVTASALLDLFTAEEVNALADACVGAGCAALLTLSVVGRVVISPPDPLDAEFEAAFNAHQRRSVGGRWLLGPDAGAVTADAFARRGMAVEIRPSPWRLGPEHAELIEEWLRGWIGAACEQQPDLERHAGAYLQRRLDAIAAGELRVVVGHVDVLAGAS